MRTCPNLPNIDCKIYQISPQKPFYTQFPLITRFFPSTRQLIAAQQTNYPSLPISSVVPLPLPSSEENFAQPKVVWRFFGHFTFGMRQQQHSRMEANTGQSSGVFPTLKPLVKYAFVRECVRPGKICARGER